MRNARLGTLAAAALLAVLAGCSSARDLEPAADGIGACDRCHGAPPAAPHPAVASDAASCSGCHATSVAADGTIVPDGTHRNGVVDPGGHVEDFAEPGLHGPAALSSLAGCATCHGADYSGGVAGVSCNGCHATAATDWRANCTFCHGDQQLDYPAIANPVAAAPPASVGGQTAATNPRVGAHAKHLAGGAYSAGFTCATCHVVPSGLAHVDRTAAVAMKAAGQRSLPTTLGTYTRSSQSCATYCHGQDSGKFGDTLPVQPQWTAVGPLACTACHAARPATGLHRYEEDDDADGTSHATLACAACHAGYVEGATVVLDLHVNGAEDVVVPKDGGGTQALTSGWDCTPCHNVHANHP